MFLLVWLGFGFLCSLAASQKGYSGCGWFILGMLLGPFALLFILIKKENIDSLQQEQIDNGELKKCPFCAEIIKKEAIVCRYCGKDLPDQITNKDENINTRLYNYIQKKFPIILEEIDEIPNNAWNMATELLRQGDLKNSLKAFQSIYKYVSYDKRYSSDIEGIVKELQKIISLQLGK